MNIVIVKGHKRMKNTLDPAIFRAPLATAASSIEKDLRLEYQTIEPKLRKNLESVFGKLRLHVRPFDDHIVGIEKRVKTLESLAKKAWQEKWTQPFLQCKDITGVRIITLNQDSLLPLADRVGEAFPGSETTRTLDDVSDDSGYRGIHVQLKFAESNFGLRPTTTAGCEVQIRSIVMHCISVFSHAVFYKSRAQLPRPLVAERSRDLFAMFRVIDKMFDLFRIELGKYAEQLGIEKELSLGNLTNFMQEVHRSAKVTVPDPREAKRQLKLLNRSGITKVGDLVQADRKAILVASNGRKSIKLNSIINRISRSLS